MFKLVNILFAAVIILAISMLALVVTRTEPSLNESTIRNVIEEMQIADSNAGDSNVEQNNSPKAILEQESLNPMIEKYLLENPEILISMTELLQTKQAAQSSQRISAALIELNDEIYNNPDSIVLGNPDGDVTLVEFFDYNCPYCRQVMPHITDLLENDKNLKVIIKEFPVLGQDSFEAAQISVAVNIIGADYWTFHEALFATRGSITAQKALDVANEMGIPIEKLKEIANSGEATRIIENSYAIAQKLDINGTPAFIIGEEIIPGAVELEQLEFHIENMRKCGKSRC